MRGVIRPDEIFVHPPDAAAIGSRFDRPWTASYQCALRSFRSGADPADAPAVCGRGVRVRPSRIPGAGRGLFAVRPFRRGELITGMDGVVFAGHRAAHDVAAAARTAAERRAVARIRVLDAQVRWIVGCSAPRPPDGIGGASYANDGRTAGANNARFATRTPRGAPHLNLVFLRAIRPIAAGEEILVSYGRTYWRRGREAEATDEARVK